MKHFSTTKSAISSVLTLLFALLWWTSTPAMDKASEYEVKAVYLYNFARFFQWPGSAFSHVDDPLVVCIYGDDPFGDSISKLNGKAVRGRDLAVEHRRRGAGLESCHVAFISESEKLYVRQLLENVSHRPLLTVSDIANFAENGGVVGLTEVENKVRFEINAGAAHDAELEASSQLLKLATLVIDIKERSP